MGALPQLRRTSLRQPVHSLAYVNLSQGNGGVILDLSETGVSLQSVKPLSRTKDPVSMEFHLLETGSRVPVQGEVVWSDQSGKVGIHFVDISRFARRRIQEWMLYNALSARDAAQEVVHQPRPQLTAAAFAAPDGATERAATPWELGIGQEIPASFDFPDFMRRISGMLAFRPGPVTSVLTASLLFALPVLWISPTPTSGALLLLLGAVAPMSFWWLYRVAVTLERWR
jgi:hypothetical protein